MITTGQVKKDLKTLWPHLSDEQIIWRVKRNQPLPMPDLIEIVKECSIKGRFRHIKEGFECEAFSDGFKAAVQEYQYKKETALNPVVGEYIPYSVGDVSSILANGVEGNHTLNIVLIVGGFAFVEPQTDEVWQATADRDYPYHIFR